MHVEGLTACTATSCPLGLCSTLRRGPPSPASHTQLLEASRGQLAHVDRLLGGGDAEQLRSENARLQRCLATARGLLAQSSPASGLRHSAAGLAAQEGRSPVPFVLFGDGEGGGEGGGRGWPPADSPATTLSACSSDLFSSPYLASRATLTVDYRDLKGSVERQREVGVWGGEPAVLVAALAHAARRSTGEAAAPAQRACLLRRTAAPQPPAPVSRWVAGGQRPQPRLAHPQQRRLVCRRRVAAQRGWQHGHSVPCLHAGSLWRTRGPGWRRCRAVEGAG